jgi:hypothetical protein
MMLVDSLIPEATSVVQDGLLLAVDVTLLILVETISRCKLVLSTHVLSLQSAVV